MPMLSPRFTPKSAFHTGWVRILYPVRNSESSFYIPKWVFYTQSVVRKPQSAVRPQCVLCTDCVYRHLILVPSVCKTTCLRTRLESPWHFHFRNNETEDMIVNPSNPVGVELLRWVYVTQFVHRKRNFTFPPLIQWAESSVGFCRREGTQQAAKL